MHEGFETVTFGHTDYSGFDRDNWLPRTGSQHRLGCNEIFKETTKSGIRSKKSEVGCRYSILLQLPYFDPVQNTAIDLMHNLYLGTGKYVFKLWIDLGVIGKNELLSIEEKCSHFTLPYSVGRLPTNISSNYGGFNPVALLDYHILSGCSERHFSRCAGYCMFVHVVYWEAVF